MVVDRVDAGALCFAETPICAHLRRRFLPHRRAAVGVGRGRPQPDLAMARSGLGFLWWLTARVAM